ncbi:hypothetical protein NQ314_020736 [Rhamnusium bicolor]|uniref:Histone deacetylase domain-containing protein n=1 Tax=Rhamnusium bicolor TaxID=1586634 RepID=A0AAV8WKV7_9CUCU|nr:hypothetical protein NQ314_020736 [Rhamnusium bicolor]
MENNNTRSSSNTGAGSTKKLTPNNKQKTLKELIAERRSKTAANLLETLDLIKRCQTITPENASEELFLKKHTNELYQRLRNTSQLSEAQLQNESSKWDAVYFTQETYKEAKLAAEAALTLTLKVANGDLKNGFALIRPPGHHAMADAFCGYCFINNVAIAAETAISKGLAKKVLIVDYDVHHGQGTQQMFYNRNDVLYFSIHRFEHGEFWPNLRESDSDYIGEGSGKGFNVNVPLNKIGLGDSDYLAIVLNLLLPLAYEFKPDLIIVSAGYDSCLGDEKGQMNVTPHFYGHIVTLLSGLANGKIVVCLEGGYFKESLAEGVARTLKALLGDVCHPLDIHSDAHVHISVQEVINNVKYFLHNYWDCFKYDELFEYPKQSEIEKNLDVGDDEHVTCLDFRHVGEQPSTFEIVNCYPVQDKEEVERFSSLITKLREEYSEGRVYNNIVGYVYDDELLKHKPTQDTGKTPPEKPERLTEIMKHFEEFGLIRRCKKIESQFDEKLWLEKVHGTAYIENILKQENLSEKPDWYYNVHTTSCIKKCVSSILSLAQNISDGSIKAGVAVIRPPGHHAMSNSGSGFCFVNNVVIAAEYLIQKERYKRILIVDFDIHHGNGTQELTYKRSDIMYMSVHRFDKCKYFPSSIEADYTYTGENSGDGYNINIPFNKGSKGDTDYWTVWHKLVLPIAYSYNPELVIISAGFDAGIYDPLGGGYRITPEMFGHFVQTLKPLAAGRSLLALEGGYHVETTALSMTMCVKALLGDPLPVPSFSDKITQDTLDTIQQVIETHKIQWPLLQVNKKLANFAFTATQKNKLSELLQDIGDSNAVAQFEEIVNQCKGTLMS